MVVLPPYTITRRRACVLVWRRAKATAGVGTREALCRAVGAFCAPKRRRTVALRGA